MHCARAHAQAAPRGRVRRVRVPERARARGRVGGGGVRRRRLACARRRRAVPLAAVCLVPGAASREGARRRVAAGWWLGGGSQLAAMAKSKKGGKKGKKEKVAKPAWMSDELWALSNNPDELIQNVRGPSSLNKVSERLSARACVVRFVRACVRACARKRRRGAETKEGRDSLCLSLQYCVSDLTPARAVTLFRADRMHYLEVARSYVSLATGGCWA